MMRVLVCGGRHYCDREFIYRYLDALHKEHPIDVLIEGGAGGTDGIAGQWAVERGINNLIFPADWDKHGKVAGPIRNQRMLDEGKPDLVVAFPGGRGTADMMKRAKAVGVKVACYVPRLGYEDAVLSVIGNASAFQAEDASSILAGRSNT